MKSRMIASLAFATMSLIFATSCSTTAAKKKSPEDAQVKEVKIKAIPGTHYTTVHFRKGKSSLDSVSKDHLKELSDRAHNSNKKIEEIRILAWADEEYPDKVEGKAKPSEIILASERAQKIRDYLEEELKETEDIDSYNMAKRPNLLSKLVKNDEYDVKEAFETSGATASKLPDGSVSYTKASKALVIIDYEGDADNLK